ncbi:type VI secretion system protein TssA [Jeongeupia chitinilytica]|nr:type VI secretion system protein TssA [Jeongeupia chitinilytica]
MPITTDFDALIPTLLQAVSADQPCGISLRHEPEYDLILEARRQDDPSLPVGIWQSGIKSADWQRVEQLCCEALQQRSKDLMLVAWLSEAWIGRYGLPGWIKGIELLNALCDRYWPDLYPLAVDGDESWRTAPLELMLRTLAESLRFRVPLLDSEPEVTLGSYQGWLRQSVSGGDSRPGKESAALAAKALERFHGAVRSGSPARLRRLAQDLTGAKVTLGALEAACDLRMRNDAPSFGATVRTLDDVLQVLNSLDDVLPWKTGAVNEEMAVADQTPMDPAHPAEVSIATAQGVVNGREDAYRQLQQIAAYLARVEPHSPVPYLINRAVEWGKRPLPDLLTELIAGDAEARRVWSLIGVLP